ncbi:MAG TPA: 30S ribosomal protein S4 [Candidatus Paceibacterota bacterium]
MHKILEKRERSLGAKLSIKGHRCNSPKCALIRKPYRPGMHGKNRHKIGEFGTQLQEKQKIRFTYGLTDKQLRGIFRRAEKMTDPTPKIVMEMLESRLDNVIFRLGFSESRIAARKMVSHGHFIVNGKRVTIPSYSVKEGDIINIRPASKEIGQLKDIAEKLKNYEAPAWLLLDKEKLEGKVLSTPLDIDSSFDVSQVVDYYLR